MRIDIICIMWYYSICKEDKANAKNTEGNGKNYKSRWMDLQELDWFSSSLHTSYQTWQGYNSFPL